MDNIIYFIPNSVLEAQENLDNFISKCKLELNVFGADLNWDLWHWPKAAVFTKLGTHSRAKKNELAFDADFMDFAKAYFRYQQGHNPTGTRNELKALKVLEAALLKTEKSGRINKISMSVLDIAAQLAREHYKGGAAYQAGRELERLAKFIVNKNLVSADISIWKHPIRRPKDDINTGVAAREKRESKMPNPAALDALAEIFATDPTDPKDIFTSCTFTLLMCAPERISEVLDLPVNCEVTEIDSKGIERYGWRFTAGKDFGADIKWIPTEMVSIAKEAIRRLTILTEGPRKLALYVEKNPKSFYRHPGCPNVEDDDFLSAVQAWQALTGYIRDKKTAQSRLSGMKLYPYDGKYTFNQLWEYVCARQVKTLPWTSDKKKIKFSEALFCMTRNMIGSQRGTSPVLLWQPIGDCLNHDLSPRDGHNIKGHVNIFERYGYKDIDGSSLKMVSHQVRHYLNTLAQRGGLSQLEIAKWSGRADPKQNRVYNHMSDFELVTKAEQVDTNLTLFGPEGISLKHVPISIQEFNTLERGPVHSSEYGYCVHDYVISPCSKFRDCLNCNEQVCIKGNQEALKRIKTKCLEVGTHFEAAKLAIENGSAGADKWYEYHEITYLRLKEWIAILEDPEIPNGSQIKLKTENSFNLMHRALEANMIKHFPDPEPKGNLANLLGISLG